MVNKIVYELRKPFQKKGVGRALLRNAIDICLKNRPNLHKITVNSSPNSVTAYEKMGFVADNDEQIANGIRFTPMRMTLI